MTFPPIQFQGFWTLTCVGSPVHPLGGLKKRGTRIPGYETFVKITPTLSPFQFLSPYRKIARLSGGSPVRFFFPSRIFPTIPSCERPTRDPATHAG